MKMLTTVSNDTIENSNILDCIMSQMRVKVYYIVTLRPREYSSVFNRQVYFLLRIVEVTKEIALLGLRSYDKMNIDSPNCIIKQCRCLT